MKILNKPNFYKDLAFLDVAPDDIRWHKDNLDGRLLSKIIGKWDLSKKRYNLFLSIMGKEYPQHIKYYPRKMLRTGCLFPQEWKIKRVYRIVDELLRTWGYKAPLYYDERCNRCYEFVNNYKRNNDTRIDLQVYCQ